MIARLNWRRVKGRYREIFRAAGIILAFAGIVRLFLPVSHPVGDGVAECGPVISPTPSPYKDIVCSRMLDTAALVAGLLIGLGVVIVALSWLVAFVQARSARARNSSF
jgi:hypothetical protein